MEQLSSCITDRMIALDIINRDDKDCYCYSVQGILEKITCLSIKLEGIVRPLYLLSSWNIPSGCIK